jgi:hypothetical protein
VLCLHHLLYGLIQAPHAWDQKLRSQVTTWRMLSLDAGGCLRAESEESAKDITKRTPPSFLKHV